MRRKNDGAWSAVPKTFGVLLFAVLAAYWPAMRGGFLWDDDIHVPRPELRSLYGLWRIWSRPGIQRQYYPLTYTVLWLEHRLWGDATLGYHLVNAAVHAAAAGVLWLLLEALEVPGALLAGAIFALHPVHVESVAWISELKNTLSGLLYLLSALCYVRADRAGAALRGRRDYALSLLFFLAALLSKSVTAVLAPALVVLIWWKRGALSWRRDKRILPFFVLGGAAGCASVMMERLAGAKGPEFALGWGQRCLIAGRAFWFYLGKLAWPRDLVFIYPRWNLDVSDWRQVLCPVAAVLLAGSLWLGRGRFGRGAPAALGLFVVNLLPVLGFVNVYPFRFSFVADHFQYLASMAPIAFFPVVLAGPARRRFSSGLAAAAILGACFILTWRQCRVYRDPETLYRYVIARNPGAFLAYNNLGVWLEGRGRHDEAEAMFQRAVDAGPGDWIPRFNHANALASRGLWRRALERYREALALDPDCWEQIDARVQSLAVDLPQREKEGFANVLAVEAAKAHNDMGSKKLENGELDEAIRHFRAAISIAPGDPDAHYALADALARQGQDDEAVVEYRRSIALNPALIDAYIRLSALLAKDGGREEAKAELSSALAMAPGHPAVKRALELLLQDAGKPEARLAAP